MSSDGARSKEGKSPFLHWFSKGTRVETEQGHSLGKSPPKGNKAHQGKSSPKERDVGSAGSPPVPELFTHMSSSRMAELIRRARRVVCYAGPGIQVAPAEAMAYVSQSKIEVRFTVTLDFNEEVARMGYGDIKAVQTLRDANIDISSSPGLRSALIVVDDEGFVFTPTALLLEAEHASVAAQNALRLTSEQVVDAMARLSPAARKIAIESVEDAEEEQRLAALPIDIATTPLDENEFTKVRRRLEKVPPVQFDLARQVRVYKARLRSLELKLSGVAIQRHRVQIPGVLHRLGNSRELEGRLRTTFDLIKKDSKISSKKLEDELRRIRKVLSPSLGKEYGRVILRRNIPLLHKHLAEFRAKLARHQKEVSEALQVQIDQAKQDVVGYYLLLVVDDPPLELEVLKSERVSHDDVARQWLDGLLGDAFPTAESLVKEMELTHKIMDFTLETLEDEQFLNKVKEAFPAEDWDRAHEEYLAAGESESLP